MLPKEAVRVLVDDRIGRRLEMVQQLPQVSGLEPGQARQAEAGEEAKRFPRAHELHTASSRAAPASRRNLATWAWDPR